jgi:hypothetical protein
MLCAIRLALNTIESNKVGSYLNIHTSYGEFRDIPTTLNHTNKKTIVIIIYDNNNRRRRRRRHHHHIHIEMECFSKNRIKYLHHSQNKRKGFKVFTPKAFKHLKNFIESNPILKDSKLLLPFITQIDRNELEPKKRKKKKEKLTNLNYHHWSMLCV